MALFFVMAGPCPGHPRLSSLKGRKVVDARDKRGHDDQYK
jgi:hypothetical protein